MCRGTETLFPVGRTPSCTRSCIAGAKQEMWQKTRLKRLVWQWIESPAACGLNPISGAWAWWQRECPQPSVVTSWGNLLCRALRLGLGGNTKGSGSQVVWSNLPQEPVDLNVLCG